MSETKKWKLLRDAFAAKAGTVFTANDDGLIVFTVCAGVPVLLWPDAVEDWFAPICPTCEKPPCYLSEHHERGDVCAVHCHGHFEYVPNDAQPVLPYLPEDQRTGSGWGYDFQADVLGRDCDEFQRLVDLLAAVYRNRRNRDVRPLRYWEECWWVDGVGYVARDYHNDKDEDNRRIDWRTREEAQAYADLQRALLGGAK